MANVLIDEKILKDIAAALRVKNDTVKTYKTTEMAAAIHSIPQQPSYGISADDLFMGSWDGAISAPTATALGAAFKGQDISQVKAPAAKTIEFTAFKDCKALTRMELGPGVVTVKGQAFEGCSSLEDVGDTYYNLSTASYQFYNCSKLKRIRIYGNVTSYALRGCNALEMVEFDGPVTKVDIWSDFAIIKNQGDDGTIQFGNPTNLKAIIIRRNDIAVDIANISSLPSGAYIYVPAIMYDAYAAAEGSSTMAKVRKIEDYPDIGWEKEAE